MTRVQMEISEASDLTRAEVFALYEAVGWAAYTRQPETLLAALNGSSLLVTARADGKLVGLARAISDGATICYLQDILVDPGHQRTGIGQGLLGLILAEYRDVRQKVLITDADSSQRAFYESAGFTEAHDLTPNPIRAFVRID